MISNYSSDGLIGNYLSKMEIALSKDSPDEVLYFLEKIHGWYGKNLNEILDNDFVFNKDEHIEAKDKIDALYNQMKSYDFPHITELNMRHQVKGDKVFIVHGHDNEAKMRSPDLSKSLVLMLSFYTRGQVLEKL